MSLCYASVVDFVNDVPDLNSAPGSHKSNMLETILS